MSHQCCIKGTNFIQKISISKMKFIAAFAVLCFCVQGSLQQCFGPNYCQGWRGMQVCDSRGCNIIQGGGGGCNSDTEVMITLYKILFHITSTTTTTPTTCTTTTTTTVSCSVPPVLVPLYQLYSPASNNYFYTTSTDEVNNVISNFGYVQLPSPGKVTVATTCPCGTALAAVYRLINSTTNNILYITDPYLAAVAVLQNGYTNEGIEFYGGVSYDTCAAILPLYNYQNGTVNRYTTDSSQIDGTIWNNIAIPCYIWPA